MNSPGTTDKAPPKAGPAAAVDGRDQRLHFAYALDGKEGARRIGLDEASRWEPQLGPLWVHLDETAPGAEAWLTEDRRGSAALLDAQGDIRQLRVKVTDAEHLLVVLRGKALDQPTPDGIKYLRIWLSPTRAVTMSMGRFDAIEDCAQQIESGRGPKTISDLLVRLMDIYARHAELAILQIDASLTDLEYEENQGIVLATERPRAISRRATELRRFMTPYREVLVQLKHTRVHWLRDHVTEQFHALSEVAVRVVEEIDAILERAQGVQDYISDRRADELNHRIYVLTLLSAVMLPLTFLTGLLGVNLGGIPGATNPWGFSIFCAILGVAGIFQYVILRRLRLWH